MSATNPPNRRRLVGLAGAGALGAVAGSAPAGAQDSCPEDTLERVRRTRRFNLGVREAAPPYGVRDAAGNLTGFATEIGRLVHEAVNRELGGGIELATIPVTSQTRVPLLQNATIDMEAGASVVTRARAKVVDFVVPHFLTATALLVPEDGAVRSLADVGGRRVGVPQGGLEEAAYRDLNARRATPAPIRTIGYPDHAQGITALQTGAIDGYSSDEPILRGFARAGSGLRVVSIGINAVQQAFLIRPASPKLKRVADAALVELFASGGWNALFDKYFGPSSPTPTPLTEGLRTLVLMNSWPA